MKIPRDVWNTRVAGILCKRSRYSKLHQVGSPVTEWASHQRSPFRTTIRWARHADSPSSAPSPGTRTSRARSLSRICSNKADWLHFTPFESSGHERRSGWAVQPGPADLGNKGVVPTYRSQSTKFGFRSPLAETCRHQHRSSAPLIF